MSLPKPTFEKLIEAIDDLDNRGDGIACCRNCYSVTTNYENCETCGLWRCDECRPIHLDMRDHLAAYLCLELEVGYSILVSLLHAYHVDVLICAECGTSSCTKCGVMHFSEKKLIALIRVLKKLVSITNAMNVIQNNRSALVLGHSLRSFTSFQERKQEKI